MKFSEIIDGLNKGHAYTRQTEAWWGKCIVKQIPQTVSKEVVPKMTSLPESIKQKISTVGKDDEFLGTISYHNQVLIVTLNDYERVTATSYSPTWEDIFADDWVSA